MRELSACRKAILNLLAVGESLVAPLAEVLKREPTNIARDLRWMRDAGLVSRQRDGIRKRYLYSITEEGRKR